MAKKVPSRSRIILLATKLASKADIPALYALISQFAINRELLLRILLSYLPEHLESASYIPLLRYLIFGENVSSPESLISASELDEIYKEEDDDDKRSLRKLHLLPLAWSRTPCITATDFFSTFLIHRCLKIDEGTGLIIEIPVLLDPFIQKYPFLKKWIVSTILPLLRLTYEYYLDDVDCIPIQKFEALDNKAAISYLLSKTVKDKSIGLGSDVGRDLRGLIGPWLYGDLRQKRLKSYQPQSQFVESLCEVSSSRQLYALWDEVFLWIISQAEMSWKTAVEAIEGWNGPGDYDLGSYEDDNPLKEDENIYLKRRYICIAIATAYTITEESKFALKGIHRLLIRIISLMNLDTVPSLESSFMELTPVNQLDSDIMSQFSVSHLKTLMNDRNPLTEPSDASIKFLHALFISATLCDRLGCSISVKYAAMLALQKDEYLQNITFDRLMVFLKTKNQDGDEFFVSVRNELLWLRSWGVEELSNDKDNENGIGIFGQLSKEFIETGFLRVLLSNTRYSLAQSLYETSTDLLIPRDTLCDVLLATATNQYDKATNANISRGSLKKCNDIMKIFSKTLSQSSEYQKLQKLLQLTSDIEPYRLVLKKGEPFKPVSLRLHEDPIMILGKILEQNPKSYKKIEEFIEMAKKMVQAKLIKNVNGHPSDDSQGYGEETKVAEGRIICMCIDAALVEDDFETAYSYVKTYLKTNTISEPPKSPISEGVAQNRSFNSTDAVNNWLWRAALQAGKYRTNNEASDLNSVFGTSCRKHEITHLEKCMDCISQSLKLAPKETLHEILNVYRRCEEELDSLLKQEAEEERWSSKTDDQKIPGEFVPTPTKQEAFGISNKTEAEEPISLFDLSRAGIMRAQSKLSALSILKSDRKKNVQTTGSKQLEITDESDESGPDVSAGPTRVRKRDQLKNVAVGGLATGVGWLIGAPLPRENLNDN